MTDAKKRTGGIKLLPAVAAGTAAAAAVTLLLTTVAALVSAFLMPSGGTITVINCASKLISIMIGTSVAVRLSGRSRIAVKGILTGVLYFLAGIGIYSVSGGDPPGMAAVALDAVISLLSGFAAGAVISMGRGKSQT